MVHLRVLANVAVGSLRNVHTDSISGAALGVSTQSPVCSTCACVRCICEFRRDSQKRFDCLRITRAHRQKAISQGATPCWKCSSRRTVVEKVTVVHLPRITDIYMCSTMCSASVVRVTLDHGELTQQEAAFPDHISAVRSCRIPQQRVYV